MESESSGFKHEALLLASVPLLGYLCAWLFEAGAAAHYEIPLYLIHITPERMVLPVILAAGLAAVYALAMWASGQFSDAAPSFVRSIGAAVAWSSWCVLVAWAHNGWLPLLGAPLTIALFVGYSYRVERAARRIRANIPDRPGSVLDGWTERPFIEYLALKRVVQELLRGELDEKERRFVNPTTSSWSHWHDAAFAWFMGLTVSYWLGLRFAAIEDTYSVITEKERDLVVLRVYGDLLVAAPFEGRLATPDFSIRKLGETSTLERRKIGPIGVAEAE